MKLRLFKQKFKSSSCTNAKEAYSDAEFVVIAAPPQTMIQEELL